MVDCWTNFAKYGDPNGEGEKSWEPYTIADPRFMLFTADEKTNTSLPGQPLGPQVNATADK